MMVLLLDEDDDDYSSSNNQLDNQVDLPSSVVVRQLSSWRPLQLLFMSSRCQTTLPVAWRLKQITTTFHALQ